MLQRHTAGIGVARLVEQCGVSRATVYRYLDVLQSAGAPVACTTSNGEARYRLLRASELPPMGFSALQIAGLHLARLQLEPLAGSAVVRELDALLAKLRPPEAQQSFRFSARTPGKPDILAVIERALSSGRRARIEYRAASRRGEAASVNIEPLIFNVADGEPYLLAYCVERKAERTYKLARIESAELSEVPATYRPSRSPETAYNNAVKVWAEDLATVKIKLEPNVAWLADEYPLVPHQSVTRAPDGGVIIEARVAGIVEVKRWVLAWGDGAEALEPSELRRAVHEELTRALGKYSRPGPAKAAKKKSTERGTRRLTSGETRGV